MTLFSGADEIKKPSDIRRTVKKNPDKSGREGADLTAEKEDSVVAEFRMGVLKGEDFLG